MATLGQLLERLRSDLDDVAEPYLWSDAELVSNINRAVDEACLRSKLIRDSDTPEVCELRLRPGIARYDLHGSVLGIRRARIVGHSTLRMVVAEVLDEENPDWQDQSAELPDALVTNLDSCWVRLSPTPTVANTLMLTVWRGPLVPLSLTRLEDEPEVGQIHQWNLLEWAKHLAYSKHDAETHDPGAADKCAAYFAELFGPRRNAQTQEILHRTPRLKTKAHFN